MQSFDVTPGFMVPPELAKHIDDLMWADLLSWRDFLIGKLLLSTEIVVAGLALEGPELYQELRSIVRRKLFVYRFHFMLPEDPVPDWVKVVAFLGWILIVAGVAGELVTESLIPDVDATIQSVVNINLESARKESALAILQASINAEESEKLKSENLKLEAVVQPRSIGELDRQRIADKLRQFAPSLRGSKVCINSQIGDGETMLVALEIADILRRADIQVDPDGMGRTSWVVAVFMGVRIIGPPSDSSFVSEFMDDLSIPLKKGVMGDVKQEYKELRIDVGVKPITGIPKEWLRQTP